jgi:hypothetical protein
MEPLLEPVVASGGNRRQIGSAQTRPKQAKTFAVGRDQLPATFHGKEGVDGSSPSEGSGKAPEIGAFPLGSTCSVINVPKVWSRLWSLQGSERRPVSAARFTSSMDRSNLIHGKRRECRERSA